VLIDVGTLAYLDAALRGGAIALFLVVVSPFMHNFWASSGMERVNEMVNFTKNMALLGSTLMFAAVPKPWPYSVEAPHAVRA